jgi:NifU-like protein involved in Fe-S cluster formation
MASMPLYTPEILGLATSLARWRWDDALPKQTAVRSRSCGSTLSLGIATDDNDRIASLGMKPQACAIGQAAAAIFAAGAVGRTGGEIADAEQTVAAWLTGEGPMPDWPGIDALAPARAYPGRHGAIMLAWQAARQLLPSD